MTKKRHTPEQIVTLLRQVEVADGGGRAARLEDRGEVGGEPGVGERGGPPPGVQARQRAEVGPSGVAADRGVGERGRVGRCGVKHNGHLGYPFNRS